MLHVLRVEMVINSPWILSKNWLVQKQTAFGKDSSNPLMADNLPKIIWFSTHHITCMKNWLVQKQTAFGKDSSNPLMADNLPKIIWFSTHHITCMKSWLVQKQMTLGQTATGKESSNPFMAGSLPKTILYSFLHKICFHSDAAQGFEQIIDFLSRSYIHHALTVNPQVYISCIKQFWNTVVVKRSGGVTRLQALVDKKRIVISEEVVREILQLNDAEGVVCLPNEEIFAGLARQRFNFSKYIFESLVCNVDSTSKFYMYPRVGKGFSGVETPLFETMLVVRDIAEEAEAQIPAQDDVVQEHVIEEIATEVVPPTPTLPSPSSPVIPSTPPHQSPSPPQPQAAEDDVENVFNQGRISVDMETDEGIELKVDQEKDAEVEGRHADTQAEIYNIDLDHSSKALSMQEDTEVQEAVEVVTTAKLITKVVTAAATQVATASTPIPAAKPKILKIAVAASAVSTRKRKAVVIRDPEKELHIDTPAETLTVKDKGKGILIEDPKPMKKKD
nr:hypothetical protein [Tanacetum cinerariifolium]